MENVLNYNSNSQLNYSVEQLRLPLDLSVVIDKADPLWSFLEIVREVRIRKNVILEEMKADAREKLDSEAGKQRRGQRSIQAEGTFGVIKQDLRFVRIHRRGLKNVENEINLVCLGFNLRKYHTRKWKRT